ncbi:LOW QUALITY PROTEIN: hypothetical protein PHPALM_13376 [Phytophthora palmivora]|uniref:Uncharacterized protein n=1 Tax=Phytophthora palmivora TaxID=4796 RepID=A0A2P4XXE8_9STRA|nr:LOW QUALITY PROTEIN: hypothetical protein PHPALM_13376 [Phytophthora palmivora]
MIELHEHDKIFSRKAREKLRLKLKAYKDIEIEAAASSIASSIKTSLLQDLQIACNAMRQELLVRVDSAEEPHREYFSAKPTRHWHCEQVRKLSVRSKRQAQRNEEGPLETTIADLVQKEVEQRFNAQQGPFRPDNNTHLQQEMQTQIQDSHESIDRTIQSAVVIIQRTIRDEVRCAATEGVKQIKAQQANQGNQGDELDGGEFSTDEDSDVEKRTQEAWRRSYMHASPSAPVTLPTNTDIDVLYVVEENTPTTLLLEKDPTSTVEEETKETSPPMTELPRLH